MSTRVLQLLERHPQGLTPTRMAQELGMRHGDQLTATLRDLHWRGLVHRDRKADGSVIYTRRYAEAINAA